MEGSENFDQINGISSTENIDDGGSPPSKQQKHKKKKPMLGKFGSLFKKKGTSTISREIDQFGLYSALLAGRYIGIIAPKCFCFIVYAPRKPDRLKK